MLSELCCPSACDAPVREHVDPHAPSILTLSTASTSRPTDIRGRLQHLRLKLLQHQSLVCGDGSPTFGSEPCRRPSSHRLAMCRSALRVGGACEPAGSVDHAHAVRSEDDLRVGYSTGKKPGKYRQSGPPRQVLLQAIGELRMTHEAGGMTEEIMNGRCVEIVGRARQTGRKTADREDARSGSRKAVPTAAPPTTMPRGPAPSTAFLYTPPPGATAKAKTAPQTPKAGTKPPAKGKVLETKIPTTTVTEQSAEDLATGLDEIERLQN